jgi:flavodoxin
MKILVVYYSRTGITKIVAEKLAAVLGADQEEIIDQSDRCGVIGYLRCGREAMKKILATIEEPRTDPAEYDLVIIGTPVWAGTMASPVRTYLTAQADKLKRVAFFVTQSGAGGNKTLDDMAELVRRKPVASLVVLSKEAVHSKYQEKLDQFVKVLKE